MKRKSLFIALSLLLVVGLAFAGPNEKGRKQAPQECQRERLLTDEERDAVQDSRREFQKEMIPLRADVKVLKMEIEDMVIAGKSAKEIAPKMTKINDIQADIAQARLEHQIEVRKIVGEEKYEKMKKMREYKGKQMKKKAGKRMKQGKGQGRGFNGGYGPRFDGEGPHGK